MGERKEIWKSGRGNARKRKRKFRKQKTLRKIWNWREKKSRQKWNLV